jgi:hypothetical protein
MPRTTVNIDASVLGQLRRRQHQERKALSDLVNQLLARALAETESPGPAATQLTWTSRAMGARIDLEDKDSLREALDES